MKSREFGNYNPVHEGTKVVKTLCSIGNPDLAVIDQIFDIIEYVNNSDESLSNINGWSLSEYQIAGQLFVLVNPKSVKLSNTKPGFRNLTLHQDNPFNEGYSTDVCDFLTPNGFREAQMYLFNIMKKGFTPDFSRTLSDRVDTTLSDVILDNVITPSGIRFTGGSSIYYLDVDSLIDTESPFAYDFIITRNPLKNNCLDENCSKFIDEVKKTIYLNVVNGLR